MHVPLLTILTNVLTHTQAAGMDEKAAKEVLKELEQEMAKLGMKEAYTEVGR